MADQIIDPTLAAKTRLAEVLWDSPEARPHMERAMVEKFGDKGKAAIPGYRERESVQSKLDEIDKERAAIRAERDQERAALALERERRSIMDDPDLRIRPDEMPAVEKIMQDELVGTHRAAARLHRAQQKVAEPRGVSFGADIPGLRGAGGDEFKGIIEDPDGWARARTVEIINDFQSGRGDKWL